MNIKKLIGLKYRILFSIIFILIGLGIAAWFLIRGFFFEGFIDTKQPISLINASQVGDFIGGVVGVIFTLVGIILLFETLALQRKEFIDSRRVLEKQQFENTFFSMLSLYKDIVNAMHFDDNFTSEKFIGKEFFVKQKELCLIKYKPTSSFFKNRKIASDTYLSFYLENKESIAHYFRTLYRIFRIIEDSKLNESLKVYYSKIVRAQLSESELFFINYNATIKYGENFRNIILKYNLLKHLPLLERLEFKKISDKLSIEKRNAINFMLEEIKDYIRNSLNNNTSKHFYKTYLKGYFAIKVINKNFLIEIIVYRNLIVSFDNYIQDGYGLSDLSNDEIEQLFKCFFLEVFIFSNYGIINDSNSLTIKTNSSSVNLMKSVTTISLQSKDYKPIKIS